MYKFGILGVGKMGSAILAGIVNSKIFRKEEILLNLYTEEEINIYGKDFNYVSNPKELFKDAETILVSIKPQVFDSIANVSMELDFSGKNIISIAAGITISYLEKIFKNAKITRIMPNTPAQINMAVATMASKDRDSECYKIATAIFNSIGKVYPIDENKMDETIPLNGSMPAFLELFAKAFIDKALKDGIDYETAKNLVCESIISSANLILKSSDDIDTLIKNVSSKGGTTLAGLDRLYAFRFEEAIYECSEACKNRSKELAK